MIKTDFSSGNLDGSSILRSQKSVGDLEKYWLNYDPEKSEHQVYETQSWFCRPDGTEGAVLWASTTLFPGTVNGEFFMTRGHFHTKPTHGELIVVASGHGILALCDHEGNTENISLKPGTTYYIDGSQAHRTINTGEQPLIFWCSWPADCGHDYITAAGFTRHTNRQESTERNNL
jgi:glucose-6-phosphate isomerase, archaeal